MIDRSSGPDGGAGVIHEIFRRRAAERPDATALIHRGTAVDYRTLDRASDAFAAELARAGVRPKDIVPVLVPRSPRFVATVLAVLKLGASYAALDPRWPLSRITELTRLAAAPLIAAASEHAGGLSRPVWVPEADLRRVADSAPPAADLPTPPVRETDTACVYFTSGSTGRPKGVLSPHAGTVRLFVPSQFVELGPGTVMPQAAPLPWDAASLELWSGLLNGGTSVLVDEPYLTVDGLRTLVRAAGVDTLWLTASVFHMLVEEDPGCFDGVRQLMAGGERLSPAHVRRFPHAHPGTVLVNGYGPAESTIFTTTHRVTHADCAPGTEQRGIPVGRPVARTEVFVLDDGLRACPTGTTGEICVAGAGLANGCLADPEHTARSFVEADLTELDGGGSRRIYRTGDLGVLVHRGVAVLRGPPRPPGEGARTSHRAGRGGGAGGGAARGPRVRRNPPAGAGELRGAGGRVHRRRRGVRERGHRTRGVGRAVAGLSDAQGARRRRRVSPHRERKAGHGRAAGPAGGAYGACGPRPSRIRSRDRTSGRRAARRRLADVPGRAGLCRGAGDGRGGSARHLLLRAGR